MTNVLFATNRQHAPNTGSNVPSFGDQVLPATPNALFCASATVTGTAIDDPDAGTITAMSALASGAFAPTDLAPILSSQNDVLVFVHGAANTFENAICRAAYNKEWLGAGSVAGASTVFDIVAFTWPARGYQLANIAGDLEDYRHDQGQAQQSAYHFCLFLQQIQALRRRIGRRRMHLLCHSMGNYMLAGAVERLFMSAPPAQPLFDEVILAAADEPAGTFSVPNGGRLSNLWRLGHEITVYYNDQDVAMSLSHIANGDWRLGYDGPANKADTSFFSPNIYEFIDCTGVNDLIFSAFQDPDRTHEYYRASPKVRADIIATLGQVAQSGRQYHADTNIYTLFPPPNYQMAGIDQGSRG